MKSTTKREALQNYNLKFIGECDLRTSQQNYSVYNHNSTCTYIQFKHVKYAVDV